MEEAQEWLWQQLCAGRYLRFTRVSGPLGQPAHVFLEEAVFDRFEPDSWSLGIGTTELEAVQAAMKSEANLRSVG